MIPRTTGTIACTICHQKRSLIGDKTGKMKAKMIVPVPGSDCGGVHEQYVMNDNNAIVEQAVTPQEYVRPDEMKRRHMMRTATMEGRKEANQDASVHAYGSHAVVCTVFPSEMVTKLYPTTMLVRMKSVKKSVSGPTMNAIHG